MPISCTYTGSDLSMVTYMANNTDNTSGQSNWIGFYFAIIREGGEVMIEVRRKFYEIENMIGYSVCKEGDKAWEKTISKLWEAFGEDTSIVDRLHPYVNKCDGADSDWWIDKIDYESKSLKQRLKWNHDTNAPTFKLTEDSLIETRKYFDRETHGLTLKVEVKMQDVIEKIKPILDEIEPLRKIANKKHIVAFDNINDLPIILVDGEKITGLVKIEYEWNTDKQGHKHFKVLHVKKNDGECYLNTIEEESIQ